MGLVVDLDVVVAGRFLVVVGLVVAVCDLVFRGVVGFLVGDFGRGLLGVFCVYFGSGCLLILARMDLVAGLVDFGMNGFGCWEQKKTERRGEDSLVGSSRVGRR
ncbi:hypothetical protein CMV_024932 [Castanea mollissima]|uniref:Transmembrane protein n=1 Tax=Castanea mollissima TaxID=60419 RepID=A0A8J4QLQ7_9ROSI|nr:hypothetical protein CMV_024932 [Castanea mollissima]